MPTLEATWETQAKGGCQLKINFLYVLTLTDGDGELHAGSSSLHAGQPSRISRTASSGSFALS